MGGRGFLANVQSPEWALSRKACETDDTALLDEAVSMTAAENQEQLYSHVLRAAIENNATSILRCLVERGVCFKNIRPTVISGSKKTSKATLEFLLANGWDINTRHESGPEARPFMWHVVRNNDMVKWCLEHGASVHPRNQEPLQDNVITKSQRSCPPILEEVAAWGSIATFELLRSKGAPLGWRTLHRAVETATYGNPEHADEEKQSGFVDHVERMAMVRHLLDVVGLDVNTLDQPAGGKIPDRNGAPICYIPGSAMLERDTRELTWLLLDRGADPASALELAKLTRYSKFAEDVEAWQVQQRSGRKCSVQ